MYSDVEEIRALLLQFGRSKLKDLYFKTGDWAVFMARLDGASNPMLGEVEEGANDDAASSRAVSGANAPHLGIFEPALAAGEVVEKGATIGTIDVLGRKTQVVSEAAGRVLSLCDAALVEYGDSLIELEAAA